MSDWDRSRLGVGIVFVFITILSACMELNGTHINFYYLFSTFKNTTYIRQSWFTSFIKMQPKRNRFTEWLRLRLQISFWFRIRIRHKWSEAILLTGQYFDSTNNNAFTFTICVFGFFQMKQPKFHFHIEKF